MEIIRSSVYASRVLILVHVAGYAFVYFEDERDAGDAIRGLDGIPFGYSRRRLSVEWSRVLFCLIAFIGKCMCRWFIFYKVDCFIHCLIHCCFFLCLLIYILI